MAEDMNESRPGDVPSVDAPNVDKLKERSCFLKDELMRLRTEKKHNAPQYKIFIQEVKHHHRVQNEVNQCEAALSEALRLQSALAEEYELFEEQFQKEFIQPITNLIGATT